ncbi:MAG: type II toxin-antitoxin system RelE/ParE family toxin [Pseudomonadota bacterium]
MTRYRLTKRAANDFEAIFDDGIDQFGLEQAREYQRGLSAKFSEIAEHPMRFPAIDEVLEGHRRSVFRSHSIYYRHSDDAIVIIRVLGRQQFEID